VHALLLAFMDSTPDWLFAKDLQHRFLFVNRSFAAAVDRTPEEMIGHRDTDFWSIDQCEPDPATGQRGFHDDDRLAFAGETVRNPAEKASVADGTIRVFDTVKSPLRAADGRILGVLCYCRDITERHRTDQALREGEQQFRNLVANLPGSVYRSEFLPPFRTLYVSDGIRSISGHEAREFLAPDGPRCGELILPEDRTPVGAALAAAVTARVPYHVRYRIRHRDGTIRWVGDSGRATYAADGTPLFLEGVHLDITQQVAAEEALREREERLAAIVDNAPVCVKLLDREGRVLEMNRAGLVMVEADRLEQLHGRNAVSLVHADDRQAFAELIRAVFNGESRTLVFDVVGLKGTRRTLETHSVPMWADVEHREVRALLGVTRDISDHLRAEQTRAALELQLRQAHKLQAIGTLAGGIAHDFNNILTAILGHAELLERGQPGQAAAGRAAPSAEDVRACAAGILAAGKRARDLVQQILTFSRRRERPCQLTRLQPIVEEALQLLRPALPANIEIRTAFACEGQHVFADATQLHQVVVNLCTNAAQAMLERGGVLELLCSQVVLDAAFCRAHPGTRPGPHQRLVVRDTGHGMAPAVLERIFEPFFTTKEAGGGAGLGLAVVHGIVRGHHGAIEVDSRPGEGTEVRIYLPVAEAPAGAESAEASTMPLGRGERVLFVDDEAMLATLIARTITDLGYRVTAHRRPSEALAEFVRDPMQFDLVLCDLTMPGMTGLEFAQHLHRIRPELPVLLTSGFIADLDAGDLQRSGIRELLEKPFLIEHLASALARHAGSRG
jgi:PAS domain S-box-containing protein